MKKLLALALAGIMALGMLTGCGSSNNKLSSGEQEMYDDARALAEEAGYDVDGNYTADPEMEELWDTINEKKEEAANKDIAREAVAEEYDSQLEDLLTQYYATTEPSEIERIAQEYNRLAVEARQAYIDAVGAARQSEFIPRSEYLAKMAYYSVAQNYASEYNHISVAATEAEGHDDDWNPLPTNMILYSDNEVTVNPEASNSVMVLEKIVQDDLGYDCLEKLLIIKDGGASAIEVNISDYVDAEISHIFVNGDTLALGCADFMEGYYIYDFSGDSLVFTYHTEEGETYYFPDNGYAGYGADEVSEAAIEEICSGMHLELQK